MDIDQATALWKAGQMSNQDYDRIMDQAVSEMKRKHPVTNQPQQVPAGMARQKARLLILGGQVANETMKSASQAGLLTTKAKELMGETMHRNGLRAEMLLRGESEENIIASLARREQR